MGPKDENVFLFSLKYAMKIRKIEEIKMSQIFVNKN
jgi:hypothetical protein